MATFMGLAFSTTAAFMDFATTAAFLGSLGPAAVHWLPTGILARPNTGQVGLYRARVALGAYQPHPTNESLLCI